MNRKPFFLLLSFVLFSMATFAKKTKLFIDVIQCEKSFTDEDAAMIFKVAQEVILDEVRFEIVSDKMEAEYVIQFKLLGKTSTKGKYDDGSVYYTASLNYSNSVVDVATGQSIESKVYKPDNAILGSLFAPMCETPEDAFRDLNLFVKSNVKRLIINALPLYGPVISILLNKNKVKGVIIGIGQNVGVKRNRRVEIIKKTKYGNEKLASIFVKNVGLDFSKCEGGASKRALEAVQESIVNGDELIAKVVWAKPPPRGDVFLDLYLKGL